MVPQPRKQNPQHQRLTVSLRKICRDYPAGAGILKELLQNADDAGASTVKFILDTRTHPESPVLVDGLSEDQGPALLAYNDALFTDKDFRSLTSLGDSKKIQDKAATGKFGLGFSSVFNWTDSPSILSGKTLLLLDPHHSWSSAFDPPGGPEYDFPDYAKDGAMINQLDCFSLVNTEWEHPFGGTIIRIPLRNASQAQRSEISKLETTEKDVQDSMESFANEMGSNGLLFLKSVRRIVLSINDKQLNEVEVINGHDLTGPKQRLKSLLARCMNNEDQAGGEVYHEVHLRHKVAGRETVKTFGIMNLVAGSVQDRSLESWAASEKLFPFVALAAPLAGFDSSSRNGRLFLTLPLPCSTGLPVHINGLFSISADRSKLHGLDDRGVQDHRPREWNKFLFNRLIPEAWSRLLSHICQRHTSHDNSYLWPTRGPKTAQLWDGMCRAVVNQVFQDHVPVWFTDVGYVALENGLLASEGTPLSARIAFREAKLPVIYVLNHVFDEARQVIGSRTLNPGTLYQFLHCMKNMGGVSSLSRLVLLEKLLHEIPLKDLGALEIFPFQDGGFRSLKARAVFLHRNTLEKTLFSRQQEVTIGTDHLSESASRFLHERAKEDDQMVRYRKPEDLRDYFLKHIANGSGDTVILDEAARSKLSQVWEWILQYSQDESSLVTLGSLWLVPLRGSAIRRLVPMNTSNFATWFGPGEVKDISLKIFSLNPGSGPKILADDAFNDEIQRRLLVFADKEQSLCIKDGNKLENFLEFLAQARDLLRSAPDDVKNDVLRSLKQLCVSRSQISSDRQCTILRSLCLYKAVRWPAGMADLSLTRYWTTMSSNVTFIGLKKLVPVPSTQEQVFIDVTGEGESDFFERLGLLRCLDDIQILEEIAMPAMERGSYSCMGASLRLKVVVLLFQNYYRISATTRSCLSSLAVVPLEKRKNESSLGFGRPVDILDPQQHALRNLYFEDEITLPEKHFYNRYGAVLAECGMVRCLDERIVLDRIRSYGRKGLQFDVVASRAKCLLRLSFRGDSVPRDNLTQVAREIKWLPAHSPDKSPSLTSSSSCRDTRHQSIIGHVWHVLPLEVDMSWISILGWQSDIDLDVLLAQLAASIHASDIDSVDKTLSYMCQHHSLENCADRLLKLSFVRSSNGKLVNAGQACRRGGEKLLPYLHTVEPRFWDDHSEIMNLTNIARFPTLEQLKHVQDALQSTSALNEEDTDVAIEVARIWGGEFRKSVDGLKIPNDSGRLVDIADLVFNDTPWLSGMRQDFVHRKLSPDTAEQLRIQPLSELLRDGKLGITDPDDDEFYQREEVADGIRDTLDRYSRESTFHEYLANADDCGSASEVNFLVDETTYGTKHLLTEDLHALQGPSLLIHNNGVFTDDDLEGLKLVGRGSKRDDPTAIGKFGRGSQTMYHWTDVPMILSGRHLLILDPLRKYLPFSYRTRQKKAGILVEYANVKKTCPDQLAPFEGLWGFDSGRNYYEGTIFRFPLRSKRHDSELLESTRCQDVSTTVEMFRETFHEARLALLFLRNLTTIDFSIKPDVSIEWRVQRGNWPQSGAFSDWANVIVQQRNSLGKLDLTTEQWWRVIMDVDDAPADLQNRHKRTMKYVECGMAAPVPQEGKVTGSPLQPLKPRIFNCLPLKFESTLPVHIHATFLLSGDRQNIATEETSKDAGSEWNKWLLEQKIPLVYLLFLEDIGRKIGHDVYKYFPVGCSGRQHLLSDIIRDSFWDQLKSSTCRLFPVIEDSQGTKMPLFKGRGNRTAPNLVTFEHAVFDILEKQRSDALLPFLSKFRNDLVCAPSQLNRHIKRAAGVKTLTPALVRGVLKSTEASENVERAKEVDKDFLKILLSFIMPTTTDEFIELDGCPILPLSNGNLGKLLLRSSNRSSGSDKMYYSANAECHTLFSFASSLLSDNEGHEKFVEKILGSGLFNLKALEKGDVFVILDCKESWSLESTSKEWLLHFWKYMNSTSQFTRDATELEVMNLDSLQRFDLVLVDQGDKETLNSLHYFQNNPVVVHPAVEEHMSLLTDFPDLGIADSGTLPTSLHKAEDSLFHLASANRFLKSIEMLATRDGKSLAEFVRANVKERNIKTLQDFVLKASEKVGFSPLLLTDSIRDLPVWPHISSEYGYLTAREALVAHNPAFVVPWVKNYHRFTKVNGFNRKFSIDDVVMLEQYVLPTLPEIIEGENKSRYTRLIDAIAHSSSFKTKEPKRNKTQRFVVPLTTSRLAARQDGRLCLTSGLFDHTDATFSAAFRVDPTEKFLMLEGRTCLSFWHELGLRRRVNGNFKGIDYLACLYALQGRLAGVSDPSLAGDTDIVLRPLCTSDGSLSRLDQTTWRSIASLPVFPVSPVSERELDFRRGRMVTLASQRHVLSLKDIVRQEFAATCWSQSAFVLYQPSTFSMHQVGSEGLPSCCMVWHHLTFLAQLAQSIDEANVEGFIRDLQKTYEFLLVHLQESKSTFSQPRAAVWFNAEAVNPSAVSLDMLKSSWTSLENLLLDSPCDAPPRMIVQPFLGRFSTLLKDIGCKSLYYPPITVPSASNQQTPFALLAELWKDDILTDVTFEAEGSTMSAHQIILASRSLYCKKQFHCPWALKFHSNDTSKVVKLEDMTYATLKILVEFCYNESHDWAAGMQVKEDDPLSVIADKLDWLLDVLVAADRWFMPDLHADAQRQVVAGIRSFVRPDNVEHVNKVAGDANAVELWTYCQEYSARNAEAVMLANGGERNGVS